MTKKDDHKKEVDALYRRFGMVNREDEEFDPSDPILEELEKQLLLHALKKAASLAARTIDGTSRRVR